MSGFTIKLEGFDEVKKVFDIKRFEKDVSFVMKIFGENVVRDAKDNVSLNGTVDEGGLSRSIGYDLEGLNLTIFANIEYGAYIEFGTRKFADSYVSSLPSEWQEFASRFKGSGGGGSFDDLVMAIFRWVQRKGIKPVPKQTEQEDTYRNGKLVNKSRKPKKVNKEADQQQLAYAIAVKIVREGIKAQPFLYPAYEKNRKLFMDDLKDVLGI